MRLSSTRHLLTTTSLALGIALSPCAYATEGGGGAYPNGSEGFMTGAMPQPGTYLVNYNVFYSADRFANSNPVFDDFKVTTAASILRAVHVTDQTILGGNWGMHAFLVAANVDVNFGGGNRQDRAGMGDFIFDPIAIGWHAGNWHWIAGVDVYLPTGRYDKNQLANMGRNYVTIEPVFDFTYRNPAGYEFSMKTMFDHNYENSATDYRSGNELHADFIAAKHFEKWAVGVGGYAYKQLSADSGEGAVLGDFKGRAMALGPQLSYTSGSGFNVQARYQHEFDVVNRPEGDKLWLNVAIAL